jgi:hypothetical protein
MKSLQITFICLLLALGMNAQKSINKFINKHKQEAHTLTMTLPGWLIRSGFNYAEKFSEDNDEKAYLSIGQHIKKLRFMVIDEKHNTSQSEIRELMEKAIDKDHLEIYTSYRDGDNDVNILVKEEKEIIKNLVIVSRGDDHLTVVTINADLPISEFKKANFSFNQDN